MSELVRAALALCISGRDPEVFGSAGPLAPDRDSLGSAGREAERLLAVPEGGAFSCVTEVPELLCLGELLASLPSRREPSLVPSDSCFARLLPPSRLCRRSSTSWAGIRRSAAVDGSARELAGASAPRWDAVPRWDEDRSIGRFGVSFLPACKQRYSKLMLYQEPQASDGAAGMRTVQGAKDHATDSSWPVLAQSLTIGELDSWLRLLNSAKRLRSSSVRCPMVPDGLAVLAAADDFLVQAGAHMNTVEQCRADSMHQIEKLAVARTVPLVLLRSPCLTASL